MRILWMSWKDRRNPLAGGAEVVNEELAKRLAKDGHEVVFLVGGFAGAGKEEMKDGYKIIRVGGRWTVYWQAYRYYKKHLIGWPDLVIDEVNTIPFMAKFYVNSSGKGNSECPKNILFIHQLCREIWFYEMFFPLNYVGYFLEPLYLRLLNDRQVITVSDSTKNDLLKFGFKKDNINIISEGIEMETVIKLESYKVIKYKAPTILTLGNIKGMKRTDEIIKAFEIAKEKIKDLELIVAGRTEGKFGQKVLSMIENSKYKSAIRYSGPVSREKKIELMQKAHLFCVISVKEGWGLVVTEAASQGTPSVVYDADGLRDSVRHNETGLVCKRNTPEDLAENIVNLFEDKDKYERLRLKGWEWSREINFEKSYEDFKKLLNN